LHREGNTEIRDERVSALQEDVLGLDVAMDDALGVRVVQRISNLPSDCNGVFNRQLCFAGQSRSQGLARHQRHDVIQLAFRLAAVEQRENVRMLQSRGGPNLTQEPFDAEGLAQARMQHLDRHVTIVPDIVCEIHGRHATRTDLALNAIAVGECRRKEVEPGAHASVGQEMWESALGTVSSR
jgi:hypothetical protein